MNALKITAALAAFVAGNALTTASAGEFYGAVRAGVNDAEASAFGTTLSFDQGQSIEAALGYDTGMLRFEAGASNDTAELGLIGIEGRLTNYSATALIDVDGPLGLTLSAGAGIDYSQAEANLGFVTAEGEGDGWHYDLAATTTINENWAVELRRRAYEGSADFDLGGDIDIKNVAWTLGVVRSF